MLRRYGLLALLHERGINDFAVSRVAAGIREHRYPVFLRLAHAHHTILTPLLETRAELEAAILCALMDGNEAEELLVVEYSDAGRQERGHQMRSVFRVADEVFAHHIHAKDTWIVLRPYNLEDEAFVAEEMAFLRSREADQLRSIFELAHIEFGRIDYAMGPHGPTIWEINTKPVILRSPEAGVPEERLPAMRLVADRLRAAFDAIDLNPDPCPRLRLRWDINELRLPVSRVVA